MDRKPMNALQQLIADWLRDHPGESYASIGRRGGIPRQTVQSLATREERRQTPQEHTIRALAKGMGLPERQVRAAAGDAAGYRSMTSGGSESPEALLMFEAYSQLDEARKRELEARARYLLEEFYRSSGGKGDAGESGE